MRKSEGEGKREEKGNKIQDDTYIDVMANKWLIFLPVETFLLKNTVLVVSQYWRLYRTP